MEPLTMALIMGGSAAVKGIGQGISSYQKAAGMMGEEEKAMLQRLRRQQEMDALGFTSGELSDMTRQYRDPQQAMALAQAEQLKQGMAQTGSPTDAFRLAMMQEEQQRQANAEIASTIAAMQQAEKQRDEQLLLGLSRQEAAQEAAKKAAIIEGITLGIGGAVESGAQAKLLAEQTDYKQGLDQKNLDLQQQYIDKLDTLRDYGITYDINLGGDYNYG